MLRQPAFGNNFSPSESHACFSWDKWDLLRLVPQVPQVLSEAWGCPQFPWPRGVGIPMSGRSVLLSSICEMSLCYFLTDPQAFVSLGETNQGLQEKVPSNVPIFIYPKAICHGQMGAVRAGVAQNDLMLKCQGNRGCQERCSLNPEHGGFYSDSLEYQKGKT